MVLGLFAALSVSACGGFEGAGIADLASQAPNCKIHLQATSQSHRLNGFSTERKIITAGSSEVSAFSSASAGRFFAVYDHTCLEKSPKMKQSAVFRSALTPRRQRYQAEKVELTESELTSLQPMLAKDPCLVAFAPDARVHATSLPAEIQLDTSGEPRLAEQMHLSSLRARELWDFVYRQPMYREKVRVAVIDSGINLNHEDLSGILWADDEGVGRNFVNTTLTAQDDNGHGSHVAGLLGADGNNLLGGSGIAPDGVELMALKALDSSGGGDLSTVINAINFAVENGAQVINMSLGGPGTDLVLRATVEEAVQKGVFLVAAAGNETKEISETDPFSPAMFAKDIDGFMSVGSVDVATGFLSSFSNFSSSYVEIMAPGAQMGFTGLLSTVGVSGFGPYARLAGTSMAAPLVAGAAAMIYRALKERGIQATPADVESLIRKYSRQEIGLRFFSAEGRALDLGLLAQGLREELGSSVCP